MATPCFVILVVQGVLALIVLDTFVSQHLISAEGHAGSYQLDNVGLCSYPSYPKHHLFMADYCVI
jgi:hypothetical protein